MSDLKLTITNWGQVAVDKREMTKLMRAAGNDIKTQTARLINKTEGGGRLTHYHGKTGTYKASAPGDPPVRASGALRSSLKTYVFKTGEGFAVRARQFYALFLETGAKGGGNPGRRGAINPRTGKRKRARGVYTSRVLEPRPFLDRVMNEQAPELERRMRAALDSALTWKETK